jgi:hypothetical protein
VLTAVVAMSKWSPLKKEGIIFHSIVVLLSPMTDSPHSDGRRRIVPVLVGMAGELAKNSKDKKMAEEEGE